MTYLTSQRGPGLEFLPASLRVYQLEVRAVIPQTLKQWLNCPSLCSSSWCNWAILVTWSFSLPFHSFPFGLFLFSSLSYMAHVHDYSDVSKISMPLSFFFSLINLPHHYTLEQPHFFFLVWLFVCFHFFPFPFIYHTVISHSWPLFALIVVTVEFDWSLGAGLTFYEVEMTALYTNCVL